MVSFIDDPKCVMVDDVQTLKVVALALAAQQRHLTPSMLPAPFDRQE